MKIQSINPWTEEVIAEFEAFDQSQINESLLKARIAQAEWSKKTLEERIILFKKLQEVLNNNIDSLAATAKTETGKVRPDFEAEVFDVIDAVDYYASQAQKIQPNTDLKLNEQGFPDSDLIIDYVPYGVIALIMPWNFPFYSPTMFLITTLMTGNAVMYKPSEYATQVAIATKELFVQAGFDPELIQLVVGGEETGKLLVKSAVDKIFFVGSVEGGKDIIANAGTTPVQIELGGNSAAIVLEDADLDMAAAGIAWGGTYHPGQDCVGIKRVLVHEAVYSQFMEKLTSIVINLRRGEDYGPFIRKEARDAVKRRIDNAVEQGSTILVGGDIPNHQGFWLNPTVLEYTNDEIELVAKETFGNVLPVKKFSTLDEAIALNNKTNYGLSTSLWTQNLSLAPTLALELLSGMVFINDPFIAIPGWDHWTGWKNSGFGTVESKIMQCVKKKVISVNKSGQGRGFWYPY